MNWNAYEEVKRIFLLRIYSPLSSFCGVLTVKLGGSTKCIETKPRFIRFTGISVTRTTRGTSGTCYLIILLTALVPWYGDLHQS